MVSQFAITCAGAAGLMLMACGAASAGSLGDAVTASGRVVQAVPTGGNGAFSRVVTPKPVPPGLPVKPFYASLVRGGGQSVTGYGFAPLGISSITISNSGSSLTSVTVYNGTNPPGSACGNQFSLQFLTLYVGPSQTIEITYPTPNVFTASGVNSTQPGCVVIESANNNVDVSVVGFQ